jgi:aspartate/methionine/tyrosine aminotransferase
MKPLGLMPTQMRRSGIREVMELAATIGGVIHLEVGEPYEMTPAAVVEAGFTAARNGFTRYTPNAGLDSLRTAIAEKLVRENGLAATAKNVVVTPGAVCALATAVLATVEPDDEVLIPDPGWPNYVAMVQLARGRPVPYTLPRNSAYQPDFAQLERLVTTRTKLLIVNSPSNPTGVVFPEATVRQLADFGRAHDLYILTDEVYEAFTFDGPHVPLARFDPDGRVISVFGFSKTYAMTGWRLGYAVAAEPVAAVITKLQEPLVSCPSSIAQKAAERALAIPAAELAEMTMRYAARRDRVVDLLGTAGLLGCRPAGAFYAWVDLGAAGDDSYAIARALLKEQLVAVAPGETFGASGRGMVRISFATATEVLEEGCRRIIEFSGRNHGQAQRS